MDFNWKKDLKIESDSGDDVDEEPTNQEDVDSPTSDLAEEKEAAAKDKEEIETAEKEEEVEEQEESAAKSSKKDN